MPGSETQSLADLRRAYYGGGSDAEYAILLDLYEQGVDASDILSGYTLIQTIAESAPEDFDTLVEIAEGKVSVTGIYATAATDILKASVADDAQQRFILNADGLMEFGGGALVTDTTLYRSAAGTLKTDGIMKVSGYAGVAGVVYASEGNAGQVTLGNIFATGKGGIYFGSGNDTNLYRDAANVLKTDDSLVVSSNETLGGSLYFGTGQDVELYRPAADVLAVGAADTLRVQYDSTKRMNLSVDSSASYIQATNFGVANTPLKLNDNGGVVSVGSGGLGIGTATITGILSLLAATNAAGGISFGTDTNLYRSASNTIKTDGAFNVGGAVRLLDGFSAQLKLGDMGPSSQAGIRFGSGEDTNLYRSAADTLGTDDSFKLVASASRLIFGHADQAQTTVGAAGGASALPATPTKFFKVVDSAGTTLVIPAYAAS